jgi:ABC-2 type transport system permease protein
VTRNTFWRGTIARKLTSLLAVLALAGISYGLYRFSRFLVSILQLVAREQPQLLQQLGDLDRIFAAVPSLALISFSLPLLLTSISFALSTLYLANDLDTLLVTPVPTRAVFLARFLEGISSTYILLFGLLAPALIGYGQALGYGAGFYVALLVVLALLPLLPISIGTLLTMVLVRIIPARRLRDVLTVLGGLFGLLVYIGSQSINRRAVNAVANAETAEQLLRLDVPWLPTAWGARAMIAAGAGDSATLLLFGGLYAAASLGLFAVCVALAERLYYSGWASLAGTEGGKVRRRSARRTTQSAVLLRGPIGAIIRKDLRILPRDIQQLSQLIFPLAISCFWIWRLFSDSQLDTAVLRESDRFADSGLVSIGLFVCVLIASHLGLTGLSREANSYWLLHLAPISPWSILWAKWTLAWLPFPIIGTVFIALLGVLQQPALAELAQDWLLIVLTGVGVAGITAGMGATFPKFDWQQPRRMTSARAGCLGSALYFLYTGAMLALTIGPRLIAAEWGGWVYATGWGVALALTGLALGLPLLAGALRLRRLEW